MKPLRPEIAHLQASLIREVANAGMGREDVLAFWFGESDEVTPSVVRQAAIDALNSGETFYTHNLGLPDLRSAIAAYTQALHGDVCAVHAGRVAVTSGGVSALMLAMQAVLGAGDDCLVVTPIWPNLTAQPQILGARVRTHSLTPLDGSWRLDLQALLDDIQPHTRLLVVNAPNNPTGWVLSRSEQEAILARCRETGTWILADEVYERLFFGQADCAPSFLDIARPDDMLMVAHSFSKSFLMTGWRLGWLVVPETLTDAIGKLIEFNTSCAPVFVQKAALAALSNQDRITPPLVQHLMRCRDALVPLLQAMPRVVAAPASAGMYAFFRIEGHPDGLVTAKRLVAEAGLGLAPGEAFSDQARGWLRWCFASRETQRLAQGAQRLQDWLRVN